MVKRTVLPWSLFPLLFYSLQFSQAHSTLFLQIGDKCVAEEKGVHNVPFPVYDDWSTVNSTTSTSDKNASRSDIENSVCDPAIPLECLAGRCQCKKGYTINRNGTKCLEVARNGLDSTCNENIQCWKSLLGRMSECNVETGKCQCYESETLPIVFHQGRCYYGEGLGEYCQILGLCEATTPNASCSGIGGSGTCQCKEGYVPSWDKSRCLPVAIGLESPCEENIQCEKSQLGALSECNQESMKCNCYKIPDMNTLFYGGKCYFEAALGDVCQVSAQCKKKTPHSSCSRDGKCFCDDDGYIPNGNNTLCLPIPSNDGTLAAEKGEQTEDEPYTGGHTGNNSSSNNISNIQSNNGECHEDSQCFRIIGPYSRCNIAKQKCECYISEIMYLRLNHHHYSHNHNHENSVTTAAASVTSRNLFSKLDGINEAEHLDLYDHIMPNLVMVGSRCYLGRFIGQTCKFNKQCSAVTEHSWCDNGRCECLDATHVRSEDGRKCLKIGLDCDEDAQCTKSELGPLSGCNLDKKRCECSNSIMPVVYFRGKCYFHRQLGTSCESNAECQAGSNYLAECSIGRCRCQNGTVRLSPHVCGFISPISSKGVTRKGTPSLLLQMVVVLLIFRAVDVGSLALKDSKLFYW